MNERTDVSLGLVVLGARAGRTAGKAVVSPVRALLRGPLGSLTVQVEHEASRAGSEARARAFTHAEAATTAALGAPEMERLLDAALEGPFADRLVRRVVDRMLESPELEHVVEHVATSPKVRAALAHTTTSVAGEVAAQVRAHAAALDDFAERTARGLVRRRPAAPASPYGGVVTRGVAFALDVALLALAVLPAAAGAALVVALLVNPPDWLTGAAVGLGWALAAAAYFVFFWTAGATPAMRVMRQRVVAANRETPPSALRAVVRFVVLLFGPVTLLVGGVLMLFDGRRRGLHDVIAGTVVVSADRAAPVEAAPAALEATA